jgi:hypothetical protein
MKRKKIRESARRKMSRNSMTGRAVCGGKMKLRVYKLSIRSACSFPRGSASHRGTDIPPTVQSILKRQTLCRLECGPHRRRRSGKTQKGFRKRATGRLPVATSQWTDHALACSKWKWAAKPWPSSLERCRLFLDPKEVPTSEGNACE